MANKKSSSTQSKSSKKTQSGQSGNTPASDAAKSKPASEPAEKLVQSATLDDSERSDDLPSLETLRSVDAGLTKKDLERYRKMLIEKLGELVGDVEALTVDALGDGGDLSRLPLHEADAGSDVYEQTFNLDLMESERKLVTEIQHALLRIKEGIYGVCLESAKPIGKARLDAKPWAKYCIDVVREHEKKGLA